MLGPCACYGRPMLRTLLRYCATDCANLTRLKACVRCLQVRSSKQDQIHNSIVSTLLALMDGLTSRGQVGSAAGLRLSRQQL